VTTKDVSQGACINMLPPKCQGVPCAPGGPRRPAALLAAWRALCLGPVKPRGARPPGPPPMLEPPAALPHHLALQMQAVSSRTLQQGSSGQPEGGGQGGMQGAPGQPGEGGQRGRARTEVQASPPCAVPTDAWTSQPTVPDRLHGGLGDMALVGG
jgi:hypothetical protein